MDIRKGDKVVVIAGDDLGAEGEVHSVVRAKWGKGRRAGERKPEGDRIVVAGINLVKKHQRRTGNINTQFGIIERGTDSHIECGTLVPQVRQGDQGGAPGACRRQPVPHVQEVRRDDGLTKIPCFSGTWRVLVDRRGLPQPGFTHELW